MKRCAGGVIAFLSALLLLPGVVRADGSLPPLPYRYLHPPPALAATNNVPQSGVARLPIHGGRAVAGDIFTHDGQAGILAPQNAFEAPRGATALEVRVQPVNTPPGLPGGFTTDGNAYRVIAQGEPGNLPVSLKGPITIVLRWPHIPTAIYVYRTNSWQQVCYSDRAILSPSTMSCHAKTLGIFDAVALPSVTGIKPTSPSNTSSLARIRQFIPVVVVIIVILIALVLGYILSRRPS